MTFSHANCTHPATSSDRAKCRRGTTERPAFPTPGPTTNGATESLRTRIKASRAGKASETPIQDYIKSHRVDPAYTPRPQGTTPAEWMEANKGRPETNPGCQHGMRFARGGCSVCAR